MAQHEKELSMFRSETEEQEAGELFLKVKSVHTGLLDHLLGVFWKRFLSWVGEGPLDFLQQCDSIVELT